MIIKYLKNTLPITLYILTLLIMLKFAATINSVLRVSLLVPIVYYYLLDNFKRTHIFFFSVNKYLIILFTLFYSLFGYNRNKFDESGANILFVIENIIIIHGLLSNIDRKNSIKYHQLAFLIIVALVVFIPSFLIVGNLELGAFYNLIDDRLLTTTTIEGPLLVSMLLLYCFYEILINKNLNFFNVLSTLFSIFLLLLFNRRGFIFSCIFSVTFYAFYQRTKFYKLIYVIFIFLFLPMFWEIISFGVLYVSESELFSSIIVRNDKEELLTATGRILGWNNILKLFSSMDLNYLIGYYGTPPESLFVSAEEGGRYQHAHNTFLQLFVDGGYLLSFLFIYLFVNSFQKYIKLKKQGVADNNFYFLVIIFLFFLSSTESLIRGIQFSNFIYIYAIVGFNLTNTIGLTERRLS